ncbi:hypothetical protein LB516_23415 [Mesorhizobium sp. CO1-1-7]|uniref:hypothetical protein n=1 Tax=unclassified Mesorhizobium TaxID=325217 RepID=UPI0015E3B310|nr:MULTISPECIES: hypothetical protein [unclassified Mesorhizobium]MBZ9748190.1 hypothetical protein [Mesorhizobium sp. CO1-1-7]
MPTRRHGSVVELRKLEHAHVRRRLALAVRSDLAIERQSLRGATRLDRQALALPAAALSDSGFRIVGCQPWGELRATLFVAALG